MDRTHCCRLDPQWLLGLANRWQFAAGLRHAAAPDFIEKALESLLDPPAVAPLGIDRLLMRGYQLELATGLRAAGQGICASLQGQLYRLCSALTENVCLTPEVRAIASELLNELRRRTACENATLADRVRATIDHCHTRSTVAEIARDAGTNVRYAARAFKRQFGVSIAQYERVQLTAAALLDREGGCGVKEIAARLQCSESTVRRLIRNATGRPARALKTAREWSAAS